MESFLNPSTLIAGFIFGILGFWLFREGKKRQNFYVLIIGILLMAYPYFVNSALVTWLIGGALTGAAWFFWHS